MRRTLGARRWTAWFGTALALAMAGGAGPAVAGRGGAGGAPFRPWTATPDTLSGGEYRVLAHGARPSARLLDHAARRWHGPHRPRRRRPGRPRLRTAHRIGPGARPDAHQPLGLRRRGAPRGRRRDSRNHDRGRRADGGGRRQVRGTRIGGRAHLQGDPGERGRGRGERAGRAGRDRGELHAARPRRAARTVARGRGGDGAGQPARGRAPRLPRRGRKPRSTRASTRRAHQ